MSDVQKAKPMDVFADADGKLWRVIGTCSEPTVYMQEIERSPDFENVENTPEYKTGARRRMNGGVGGAMWEGFKLIYRPEIKQNDLGEGRNK